MTTTSEMWKRTSEYSEDVTKNGRQLAFAGVAVCWVLREQGKLSEVLVLSLGFFALFFFLDYIQNVVGFLVRSIWLRSVEVKLYKDKKPIDGDIDQPWWIDRPGFILFCVKVTMLPIAFGCIVKHVITVMLV